MADDKSSKTVEGSDKPVWTPPSQQAPPQYPAIKPGEPVPVNTPDPLRTTPKARTEKTPPPRRA